MSRTLSARGGKRRFSVYLILDPAGNVLGEAGSADEVLGVYRRLVKDEPESAELLLIAVFDDDGGVTELRDDGRGLDRLPERV